MESEWIQIRLFLLRIPHFPIQASDDTPARGHLRAQDLALAKDSRRAPQDDHRKNRPRNNRLKRHQAHRPDTLAHGTGLQGQRIAPQRRSLGAYEA